MFTIPTTFEIAHARVLVLHTWGTGHPICDLSWIIATRQLDAFTVPLTHNVSNKCIYFQSHLFASTNSIAIDLMTIKDWFFFSATDTSPAPPAILPFLLVSCCDCRWLRNDFSIPRAPENTSHKTSLQFISTFGRNITLSVEFLRPPLVFQWNINLRERHRLHRHLISPTRHGCTAHSEEMRYSQV